ncbi:MAG: DNA ligase [Epsilonproteobacteria bacterium]|nr:DNA ligase [Campylobacterota bacterium]
MRFFGIWFLFACLVWADKPSLLLLESYKDQNISGWLMSEKMDGVRAYWDGEKLISRGGTIFATPLWFTKDFPPFAVDGELWSRRGDFEHIQSIVMQQKAHEGWRELAFYAFDVPKEAGGLTKRLAKLDYYLSSHSVDYLKIAPQFTCKDENELQRFLHEVEKAGGEGVVIRHPNAPYVTTRDAYSLKVKTFHDAECRVLSHHKGEGKYKDVLGSLTCKNDAGIVFKIGSGFSEAERQQPPAIGARITYKYKELTKNGKPRFPVFVRIREDL